MKKKLIVPTIVALAAASAAQAQELRLDRLSADQLEVLPPSDRVEGSPGHMRIKDGSCRVLPTAGTRRRIVDIALQEWGFFGFRVVDQTIAESERRRGRGTRRRTSRLGPQESIRVAGSIAGYWSVTSDGSWILDRQNAVWNGYAGVAADWRDPWSAAFVSWVMCEGGLGEPSQFRRAIAHYEYIDQAIEARDDDGTGAAFVAYDVGEMPVEPGDLVCSARRSAYRSIAERRPHLGIGIRSHCDIVIRVDEANGRILGIGGNVRDAVSLKLLPAVFDPSRGQPVVESIGRGRRTVFAHLKLQADPIEEDALETSPTIEALRREGDALVWLRQRLEGGPSTRFETVSVSPRPTRVLPSRL